MSNLKKHYQNEIAGNLFRKLGLKSIMQVPKLEKVVINMGVGDATHDGKFLESAIKELTLITNQVPVVTKAKKSIANYKLRQGQAIGVKVTLRNANMWAFVDKLFNIALPRVRDFRGLSPNSFDGRGNFTIGIKEQIIFNEVDYDQVKRLRGMDITFITSTNNDQHAYELLLALGLPFIKKTPKEKQGQ